MLNFITLFYTPIFATYLPYLRPSEERPAGVAGDGPVMSAGLLRGNAADGAHIGRGLASGRHLTAEMEASIQFI